MWCYLFFTSCSFSFYCTLPIIVRTYVIHFHIKKKSPSRILLPFWFLLYFPFLYKDFIACITDNSPAVPHLTSVCASLPLLHHEANGHFSVFLLFTSLRSTWDCRVLWPFWNTLSWVSVSPDSLHPLLPLELIPLRVLCYITAHDLAFNFGIQGFKFVPFLILLYIFSLVILSMPVSVNAFKYLHSRLPLSSIATN